MTADLSGVSPPTPPTETLRERLQANQEIVRVINARLDRARRNARLALLVAELDLPVAALERNAVAALAQLDAALQVAIVGKGSDSTTEDWRCVYDPDPVGRPETGNNT